MTLKVGWWNMSESKKPKFNVIYALLFTTLGVLLGLALAYLWFYTAITGFIESIPINSIQIDFNETEMIQAMIEHLNNTGQLQ